ncbi:MAG: phosphate ABC transporter permease PstA [Acidobacteria bacterium]|nr:phosphate ABC transporter permease PstA [Acidobacteriota bacterium]
MTRNRRRRVTNTVMLGLTACAALAATSILFLILAYLIVKGGASINVAFFTQLPRPVGEVGGGMGNAIVGSAKLIAIAACLGLPLGFATAVYLSEFAPPRVASAIRYVLDLLNGVPSIVIGIFVYALLVIPMRHFSTVAGGVALGLIIIPVVGRSAEEFLRTIPSSWREASLALGATRATTVFRVVVPAALPAMVTAAMLALARVAGETAPLLFTALNNRFWSPGINQPTASLPVMIFTYAISPYPDWHRQAWAAGLVLLALVLAANVAAGLVLWKRMGAG